MTDAPIDFHQEQYDLEAPDFEKVKEIFEELEFRRLYENMYRAFAPKGEPVQAAAEETVKKFRHKQSSLIYSQVLMNWTLQLLPKKILKPTIICTSM